MQTHTDFDIAIVGGGMVGASLACALGGSGLNVAVIEAVPLPSASQPSYDERSTALAPTTRRILGALGLWPAVRPHAAPIREIRVSDRGRFGMSRMDADEEGLEALGYVVPNRCLGDVFAARLAELDNVTLMTPVTVEAVRQEEDRVCLDVRGESEATITARLAVAADGARSRMREMIGVDSSERDYGQHAVVCNVTPARDPAGRAFERFTERGPLAVLPLDSGRCAVVWTLPPEAAERVKSLSDEDFLRELQDCFGWRLGRFLRVGCRAVYPLTLLRSREFHRGRVVIVGNAAHTLHPVAGQGFNLALRDVAELAERIFNAADPGDPDLLHAYAQARMSDYRRTVGFTDGLVRLFSHAAPGVTLARNLGLMGMELLPGVKRGLMRSAMGRAGRLSRLARGVPLAASSKGEAS